MPTIIVEASNSNIISIPQEELEKLGINAGDEIELYRNESNEIVLRPRQNERERLILTAARKIIENRKSALIELGKGHE